MALVLHSFWRATAPYRVRIGLHLKGVDYVYAAVDMAGAAQHGEDFRRLNPQGLAPVLVTADGRALTQSLAILEWLDETQAGPGLLPADPAARAVVRAMAEVIACDVHPLNNLRVLQRLQGAGLGAEARAAWTRHWISEGFRTLEPLVRQYGRGFSFGERPTIADCCLVPGTYSARRFGVDLSPYPAVAEVARRCADIPAFVAAHPNRQPDFPPDADPDQA